MARRPAATSCVQNIQTTALQQRCTAPHCHRQHPQQGGRRARVRKLRPCDGRPREVHGALRGGMRGLAAAAAEQRREHWRRAGGDQRAFSRVGNAEVGEHLLRGVGVGKWQGKGCHMG
eukprot:350108-Chlamydomonas_euryale.AAC.1